jgi:hypothetical protein
LFTGYLAGVASVILALVVTIWAVSNSEPTTKTCYVTEWATVKKNGQTWKEPETTICVKGEGE